MAEFGQTGKWLILPVKLCVLFLGAYYVFVGVFKLGALLLNGPPPVLTVNDTANVFGSEPTAAFLEQFPEAVQFNVIGWLVQLHTLQLIIYCVGGFLSGLALFCFYTFAAYSLYVMTWVYGAVFFITHAGVLLCYQRKEVLDMIPSFRGQKEFQALFFGELTWPSSFWYQFAAQMIVKLYVVYAVADLYYSWYLILKAGGSGWELLPANELPGWERYLANEQKKMDQQMGGGGDPFSAMGGAMGGGHGGEGPPPEELQMLMEQLQRMQQMAGGRPPQFGDVPPMTGIPVRPA